VLKVDGEVGDKKTYDPRSYMKKAEASMTARVIGEAHLISFLPDEGEPDPEPGTAFAYRCADCNERFDVVMDDDPGD
jgi:hypothetical protein